MEPIVDDIRQFYKTIFGPLVGLDGYIGVMFRSEATGKRWNWWFDNYRILTDLDRVAGFVADVTSNKHHADSMTCLAKEKLPRYRAGGDDDASWTAAVAADFDGAPDEVQAFREQLDTMPLPPTMVVSSGGGLHVYWSLLRPVNLRDEVNFWKVKRLRLGIARWYNADEGLQSPSHKLRVPGTINWKPNRMRPAKIESVEPSRCYELDDFPSYWFAALRKPAQHTLPEHIEEMARQASSEHMTAHIEELAQTRTNRNNAANAKAFWFGRRLGGEITYNAALEWLYDACVRNGLVDKIGEKATRRTIESGLSSGQAKPLTNAGITTRHRSYRR